MTRADRAWFRRQLAKLRQEIRDDVIAELNDALRAEAQTIFLERMTQDQPRQTQ